MFVKIKRNFLNKLRIFKSDTSNIVFINKRKMRGFTRYKIYKPFGYTCKGDYYTNFCIFDDKGRVLIMDNDLINNEIFEIIYSNKTNFELKLFDFMSDIDKDNEKYKECSYEFLF